MGQLAHVNLVAERRLADIVAEGSDAGVRLETLPAVARGQRQISAQDASNLCRADRCIQRWIPHALSTPSSR